MVSYFAEIIFTFHILFHLRLDRFYYPSTGTSISETSTNLIRWQIWCSLYTFIAIRHGNLFIKRKQTENIQNWKKCLGVFFGGEGQGWGLVPEACFGELPIAASIVASQVQSFPGFGTCQGREINGSGRDGSESIIGSRETAQFEGFRRGGGGGGETSRMGPGLRDQQQRPNDAVRCVRCVGNQEFGRQTEDWVPPHGLVMVSSSSSLHLPRRIPTSTTAFR